MLNLNKNPQIAIGIGLILLMAVTRGQHAATIDALPSASWAVFFLAGVFLRPRWMFPLLFLQAVALDVISLGGFTEAAKHHCVSPAYAMLLPAYATLWFGGRLYSRIHRDSWMTLAPLVGILLVSAFVSNLFSSGGYYYFSGVYTDPTLSGLWGRIELYLPPRLLTLFGYVGAVGGLIQLMILSARPRQAVQA
ncbi:Optional hypothetical component of the B12 transporter BtuM [Marinobacterium lacunae]|uniref:Optional hypothetical component of the B12 transporter BtuM n=1 Tax=Marinobacterium lacunae TaxID=1232683 RepID=A0A081G2X7_9GAMM|nr:hypothetical protein [Marinobacterium lacunae]KEA65132.1 Optional hypothetical component of the B12 transporter BtuM [Marinobacterium lacunae]MBR9884851.1 hypothetical protein [Oceanospirillales bacterium]